ncbi:Malate dehydrogenase 1B [Oopsacas minuta]|uniref:Malate dehydrogenase 1B n=1 Tax=Oopsacas minuta TaxID=111878 RepID=A0AAV7K1K9_9METZ|nr:Malate dehydrogenase 1B [Oopsacas minuta]
MANLLLFGKLSCAETAKAERVLDTLTTRLPAFYVHKELIEDKKWDTIISKYLKSQKMNSEIKYSSPLIFRELIERGGKSILVGGLPELLDYTKHYYSLDLDLELDYEKISSDTQKQEKYKKETLNLFLDTIPQDYLICIITSSDSDSDYFYNLLNLISDDSVFGKRKRSVYILSSEEPQTKYMGWVLELQDTASPYVHEVKWFEYSNSILKSVDFIFWHPSEITQKSIETTLSVIIRSLKSNTNKYKCLISGKHSFELMVYLRENLKQEEFTDRFISSGLYVEMKAKSIIAGKLNVNSKYVSDVIVLGDPWGTLAVDFSVIIKYAKIQTYQGGIRGPTWFKILGNDVIYEKDWDSTTFKDLLKESLKSDTQYNVIAASLAKQATYWVSDTITDTIFTSTVSHQEYATDPLKLNSLGIPFSNPVTYSSESNTWKLVEFEFNENELTLLEEIKERLKGRKSAILSIQ